MAFRISIIFLFLMGCANPQEELLFDRNYDSLCAAFTDMAQYAVKIHINKTPDDYGDLRIQSSKKFAANIGYDKPLPSSDDCLDIESIAELQSKKSKKDTYSQALSYFMQEMDPHSLYIPESNINEMKKQDKNITYGIGIEPKYLHRAIKTVMPIDKILLDFVYPDTPAYKKLKAEDEIEEINGVEISGKSFTEVASIISKSPDKLEIKVKRLDDSLKFSQTSFQKPALYGRSIQDGTHTLEWIRISKFVSGVSKQLHEKLEQVNKSDAEGLILDLRGNPGGLVDEGVDVLKLFLSKTGEVFHTEGTGKTTKESKQFSHDIYKIKGNAFFTKPLVVLVDSDTASIAEAVAGALRNESRALVLGNKTFGKASVQVIQPVSNRNGFGGSLITTVSVIYYPNEDTHQVRGIEPDYALQDSRFEESVQKLKQSKQSAIFYEKDYTNAIPPHKNSPNFLSGSNLTSMLNLNPDVDSADFSKTCVGIVYQKCLETYATRFLEIMINRQSL